MAGELQKKGSWSDSLPFGQDVIGKGFPAPTGELGKLGPFVGTEYKIDEGDSGSGKADCSPLDKFLYGSDCKFDPLGGVASEAGGAVMGIAGPWLTKGALLGLGAILLILGLWALLRNGPIAQGFKEGIREARG